MGCSLTYFEWRVYSHNVCLNKNKTFSVILFEHTETTMRRFIITTIISVSFTVAMLSQDIPVISFDKLAPMLEMKNDTVYMVNFWATWCTPCVEELPDILKFAGEMKNRKFRLLLVSLDMPNQLDSRVRPFIKKMNIGEKVVLLDDPDANRWINKVSTEWSGALPATLFYSRDFRQFNGEVMTYSDIRKIVEPKLKN
jgi:thiol-disulfide isomerase/thioredoxin